MSGIAEFLNERIDEDAADPGGWPTARVLREVAARRTILALHPPMWPDDPDSTTCSRCGLAWPCATLRALAAVYSDHPDYPDLASVPVPGDNPAQDD